MSENTASKAEPMCNCHLFACVGERDALNMQVTGHHPNCQNHPDHLIAELVGALLRWASEEDGVPDFVQPSFDAGRRHIKRVRGSAPAGGGR